MPVLSVPGEDAGREQGPVGLLQAGRRPRRRPEAAGRWLPAGQPECRARCPLRPACRQAIWELRAASAMCRSHASAYSPLPLLFGQLLLGLINGAFYALLSLGPGDHLRHAEHHQLRPRRAVHAGRVRGLDAADAEHLARHDLAGLAVPDWLTLGYWPALILAPLIVGAFGAAAGEDDHQPALQARPPLRPAADLRPGADPRGPVRATRSAAPACRTASRRRCRARTNLGFMFMPNYRGWVVVAAAGRVPGDLADHREDLARRHGCAPRPRTPAWCRPSASTCRA